VASPTPIPAVPPSGPQIGWLSDVAEVPLFLKGPGLKSHTLVVGQSGSGKSFMLGRLLEEILIRTEASVLILDPNADFIKFSETEPTVWQRHADGFCGPDTREAFEQLWKTVSFRILSARHTALSLTHALAKVAPPALPWPGGALRIAAMLGFDTKVHVEEVHSILRAQASNPKTLEEFVTACKEQWQTNDRHDGSERADLAVYTRAHEIGVLKVWATDTQPATVPEVVQALLSAQPRVVCVDLASLEEHNARLMVAASALNALWTASRKAWFEALRGKPEDDMRKPVFVVIDEAHNLAPIATAVDSPARTVRDVLARIATEGRKYGIYLVLATQRPGRLDETLRTQCDNLCLLKMNDRHDLQLIEQSFGFIPQGWAQRSMDFKQGELLLGGALVDRPVYARTSPRRTVEGGRNIRDSAWLPYLRKKPA
jgi:uncharacterized protein